MHLKIALADGAWADASRRTRGITARTAESVRTSAVTLPLTSLSNDAAASNRGLDHTEGPIGLVGRAYAGIGAALGCPDRMALLCLHNRICSRRRRERALAPQTPFSGASRQLRHDLAARMSLRVALRTKRVRRRSGRARCRAAAAIAELHHFGQPHIPILVPGGRRPANDRPRDAALHGRAVEGADKGAMLSVQTRCHHSGSCHRHPRRDPLSNLQLKEGQQPAQGVVAPFAITVVT
jgi:hypothetical protein